MTNPLSAPMPSPAALPSAPAPSGASHAEIARTAEELGLECHAGHGLTFDTVGPVAAIQTIVELNIGHFLIGEGIFGGLESAIKRMRALMDKARAEAGGERSA